MSILKYFIPVFLIAGTAFAQKIQTFEDDSYNFNEFNGTLRFNYYLDSDSNKIKKGNYSFNSEFIKQVVEEGLNLSKISLSGNFHDNKKDKSWTYNEFNYKVNINDIQGTWRQSLSYDLNGIVNTFSLIFNQGLPSGQWSAKSTPVKNGIQQKEKNNAFVNFQNGIFAGNFYYDGEINNNGFVKISGKLNNDGFADGEIKLEYTQGELSLIEKRIYENGFLLSVVILDASNDSIITELRYTDIKDRLDELAANGKELNYTISERGFGINFDNGYSALDPRNFVQNTGNNYLFEMFHLFDKCFIEDTVCFILPQINFTRRFRYIYPATDDSMVIVLKENLDRHITKLNEFVENPKYIINKQKSDSLSHYFAFIQHSLDKAEIINKVVTKVETGFFDFLYRPNYYKNGVEGLNAPDTVEYKFEGKVIQKEFIPEILITTPENLLMKLNEYLQKNEKIIDEYIAFTNSKIKIFEKQEQIDSLETKIVKLNQKIDSLYGSYSPKELKDLPVVYKIHSSINNRLIEKLSKEFINSNVYEEKITIGNRLVCLLKSLSDNYTLFSEYEKFDEWINKKFTIFQKNPFDDRLFEGKILGNIERSARILYRHYHDEILKANTCQIITENVANIHNLKKQIDYFINNNNEETQRINKALRRENVPARIERLFYQTN
jgi:hypothetical protein